MQGERHVSLARVALVLSLPLPGYSPPLADVGGFTIPTPAIATALDREINEARYMREAFDSQGLSLPEDGSIVVEQGTYVQLGPTPTLSPELLRQLEEAPTLDADSDNVQDLYDGPRRLSNLERRYVGSDTKPTVLPRDGYEDIIIDMRPGDALKVANITPVIGDKLGIELHPNKITIRNLSDFDISSDRLRDIYVQVVQR